MVIATISFPSAFSRPDLVAAKPFTEVPRFRSHHDDGSGRALDEQTLLFGMVVHERDLEKWDSPTGSVVAPEPHNRRRVLLLPSLRLRAVLLLQRKPRVNVHESSPEFDAPVVAAAARALCHAGTYLRYEAGRSPSDRSLARMQTSGCLAWSRPRVGQFCCP